MNLSEVMKSAPKYITQRYGSLNSYVWESLYPQAQKNKLLNKISNEEEKKGELRRMKEVVDEATLLLFIFVTRRFFEEGSEAAKRAVDIFKELGVNEFYLGSTKFEGRNENVLMGEVLANKLFESLPYEMRSVIAESRFMSDILDRYRDFTR